jgi:hypothetical protein
MLIGFLLYGFKMDCLDALSKGVGWHEIELYISSNLMNFFIFYCWLMDRKQSLPLYQEEGHLPQAVFSGLLSECRL